MCVCVCPACLSVYRDLSLSDTRQRFFFFGFFLLWRHRQARKREGEEEDLIELGHEGILKDQAT